MVSQNADRWCETLFVFSYAFVSFLCCCLLCAVLTAELLVCLCAHLATARVAACLRCQLLVGIGRAAPQQEQTLREESFIFLLFHPTTFSLTIFVAQQVDVKLWRCYECDDLCFEPRAASQLMYVGNFVKTASFRCELVELLQHLIGNEKLSMKSIFAPERVDPVGDTVCVSCRSIGNARQRMSLTLRTKLSMGVHTSNSATEANAFLKQNPTSLQSIFLQKKN